MKGDSKKLLKFFDGSDKRFIIPVYQRNYDWRLNNCKQLYDDLVVLILNNKKSHFFGSVVSSSVNDEITIIDGQQRITTVSLLIIAMINIIKEGLMVPEDHMLQEKLYKKYIVDEYQVDTRKVKLKPFRRDCDAFDALIYKSKDMYIPESKVTINYNYFYNRILNRELTIDQLYTAISSLEIIHIQLEIDHGDDPQLIFESINSTGLDLTESDKIRNLILMNLTESIQEKYYDSYWVRIESNAGDNLDLYIRDYLTLKTGAIPAFNKIYAQFKEFMKNGSALEEVLQDMLCYSNWYKSLRDNCCGFPVVNEVVSRLNRLECSVAYPFLMSFLRYAKETEMPENDVQNILTCIETYLFRRIICGIPTNALNKIFTSLHKTCLNIMSNNDGATYSQVLIYNLTSRQESGVFPIDEDFIQSFSTKNIYKMREKNKIYIFDRLENACSKEKNDISGMLENGTYSIEHIMPQVLNSAWKSSLGAEHARIHEEWLHTIANLTLTAYNPNYSNQSFIEKRDMVNGFKQSGLRLNQNIAKYDQWTEKELKERKSDLMQMALNLWAYPVANFSPKVVDDEFISLAEDFSFTYRYIKYFTFEDVVYTASSWSEATIQILQLLYKKDPSVLISHIEKKSIWLHASQAADDSYRKIGENVFLCTKNDTRTKIRILRNIIAEYGMDEDVITFALGTKNNPLDTSLEN